MAKQGASNTTGKSLRTRLVQTTAAKLRDIILARAPGAWIGSLNEVGALLGVGIVTVQQAARILEHEGLLTVRRGPGGGYYGARPDEAALERALAAYMRVHGFDYTDALEIVSLLDCEMAPAAARCADERLRDEMRLLCDWITECDSTEARVAFEGDLRRLLFKMDARPFIELIFRVTTQLYDPSTSAPIYSGKRGAEAWKVEKRRIIEAILKQDAELARFEAGRHREQILGRLQRSKSTKPTRTEGAEK